MKFTSFPFFTVPTHNAVYEGQYPATEFEWLTVCASDKAQHLDTLLARRVMANVLDVGCGSCAVLAAVIARGIGTSHQGVDVADPTLCTARRRPQGWTSLPTMERTFLSPTAALTCPTPSHLVEHVLDPRFCVKEVARVAARWVHFEVPCELHLRADTAALQRTLDIGHINAYTPESFVLLLQTAGLQVIDARVFDHSAEVQAFFSSPAKGRLKRFVRSNLVAASPTWATSLFTYHVGVLCAR